MTAKDGGEPPKPLEGLEEANADYMGFSHEQLVEMISTIDPGQVGGISDLWNSLGNSFVSFSEELGRAMEATKSEWQGAAGDAARDYTTRLGQWFGAAGHAAEEGGMGVSRQSDVGSSTQRAMPQPIQFSMDDAISMMATGGPLDWAANAGEIQQKFEEKQLRHQEAARIVEIYDRELYANARAMPDLGRPPMMTGDGGDPPIPPPPPRQWPPERKVVPPEIGGDDRSIDTRTTETGDDKGQTTKQETVVTPPETKPPVQPPTRPPVVPPPVNPPVVPPIGPPIGGPGRGPGGAGRGGVGAGRGPGGSGGVGGRSGAGGPGSGFGPRGGPGGAGGPGAGARGFGPGGGPLGGQGAPGRGGPAGAAGRGGAGGMPMGAGGRGQGGEDGEHKRPDYLIEPDPDEVFGTDEMTAPPVIGE